MNKKPSDLSNANLCRLCLQSGEQITDIFDHVPYQPEEICLSSKIMACVSVEILPNDQGPHKICNKCLDKVNCWYQFSQDCKMVDSYLQKYLNEATEPSVQLAKVDDIANPGCENSLFNEISLSSFDSVFGKNPNLSSILDVYFTPSLSEVPQLINQDDQVEDVTNTNELLEEDGPNHSSNSDNEESKKSSKGYHCELCDDTFNRFTHLLNHDDTVHQTIFRGHSCSTCGRLFISESRLKMHSFSHREKSHKCTTCDKLFSSAKSLQVHSRLHTGKYKCTTCGYVSTSKLYLEEHLLKHVGSETMYVCKICSMSFTCRSSLLRHENTHLKHGGKFYKCHLCSTVTRRRCELKDHMAVHSELDNEHKCNVCSRSYKSRKTLLAHLTRHKDAKFVCSVCQKELYSKHELRVHEGTHSDAKLFNCFHCDKKFSFKNTLVKHLKSQFPRVRSDIAVP